jgi:eukaryotic-like serine/threonine-protein kinase
VALPPYDRLRLKEVFAGARALPASDRQAYLSAACAGSEALRQEVESLLASDERAKSFLESPAVVWGDGTPHPAQLMIEGRRLGAYQVQALLGAGGMGEVYRARDTKLQRDVAVKFLPHAFTSDPERLSRFEGEARMLAALNHPNIGAIYGFEEAEGLRFLVLELVDGPTLADKLADVSRQHGRSRGLPIRDALSIAGQIAAALDVAHEKGIIHRDLKPAPPRRRATPGASSEPLVAAIRPDEEATASGLSGQLSRGSKRRMVPVRGYAKEGDTENVEFVGIAA